MLNRSILRDLNLELFAFNPFISLYKTAYKRLQQQDQQDQHLRILLNPQMRLIDKTSTNCRHENLLTTNKVAVIIQNEYTEASYWNILLVVRDPVYRQLHLEKVPVANAAYLLLHHVLLFLRGGFGRGRGSSSGSRQASRGSRSSGSYGSSVRPVYHP
jgi:uncharacterized membrane protein YgcG